MSKRTACQRSTPSYGGHTCEGIPVMKRGLSRIDEEGCSLSPREEKVLRMRHGLPGTPGMRLESVHVNNHPQVAQQLAALEWRLLSRAPYVSNVVPHTARRSCLRKGSYKL